MRKLNLLFFICLLFSLTSCFSKKTKKKNTSNNSTSQPTTFNPFPVFTPIPNPTAQPTLDPNGEFGQGGNGTGFGDGNEDGINDGGQTTEYFSLDNIIVHGTANPNRYAPPGGKLWSSEINISPSDQGIFFTNARFNVRVRPQSGPAQNSTDIRGIQCRYNNDVYNKLRITVCLRSSGGSCVYTHTFDDVPVGQVSKVKEFTVPQNTSDPLVLEVLDVQWDYSCIYYGIQGYSDQPGVCPWGPIWDTQCARFDIQFSTDTTTDLPGPRY